MSAATGRLFGLGLGPGDPELVTLKAARLLQAAPVVAYFAKSGRRGHARAIAEAYLAPGVLEAPLFYPITTEIPFDAPEYGERMRRFYEASAELLAQHLRTGRDVALICEGDPLFYGSFMHLYVRLRGAFPVTIVPGISGMSGCWTAAGAPMTWGDDILTILPGTLPLAELTARLAQSDAAVIMKIGRNFAKVRAAVAAAGRLERAIYVERGTMAGECVMPLAEKRDAAAPYFALILAPGEGRRP